MSRADPPDGPGPAAPMDADVDPRGSRAGRTTRLCVLCPSERGPPPAHLPVPHRPKVLRAGVECPPLGEFAGPFLPDRNGIATTWAHQTCIMWCPEVYFDARRERLRNVESAIKRGKQLKCSHCGIRGATVGCTLERCPRSYHLACAHAVGCRFNADAFTVTCPVHKSHKRTPAPVWSKTMNGDERLAAAAAAAADDARADATGRARDATGPSGATTLLDRLARGAAPAPNASGRPQRRRDGDDDAAAALEEGIVRPSKMSKIDRTRGVIAAVVAAGERVRREAEHEDDDEEAFAKRERRRLVKDKGKIECVTVGGSFGGGGFGGDPDDPDALPGGWETLAGMAREIRTLKELALLPLVYPEAFERLGVSPGRGVLLHGPPGTGKTAAVKALLGAAARGPRPVSFFSRKGADCLGKYMGEAERSLRLLFQEAERRQPSIVFFDEIDGLAPARKAGGGDEGDAIHGSVVATLLALMDGLNPRGSVVVVAATNRPDAVDPALRRPGRFDRELRFALPGPAARRDILRLHTRAWNPRPSERVIYAVAKRTEGAAGADLRALASAAMLSAIRRRTPKLLAGDATRERLAAALEPMLPTPPKHAELLRRAREAAAKGHVGASLAQRGAEALGARVDIFWSGNDAFFPGTVSGYDAASLAHAVTYDDGDRQWLRLWREGEVVRVLSLGDEEKEETKVAKEAEEAEAVDGEGAAKEAEAVDGECAAKEVMDVEAMDVGANGTEAKEAEAMDVGANGTEAMDVEAERRVVEAERFVEETTAAEEATAFEETTAVEEATAAAPPPPRSPPAAEALSPMDASELAANAASENPLPSVAPSVPPSSLSPSPAPSEDPRAVLVTCKNKTGRFQPSSRLIRCECAPCVAATAAGAHAVSWHDPRRWEQHCGMGHAKKWKQSIRVVLDPAGEHTVPLGRWIEMDMAGVSTTELARDAAADANGRKGAAAGGRGGLGLGLGLGLGPAEDPAPFDVDACATEARRLRAAHVAASARGGGLRVTARDWASALVSSTGPCARRSAAGSALASIGAPLPRHLAPALARPLARILRALREADAPLDDAARRAAEEDARAGGDGDAEALLIAAGAVDAAGAGADRVGGERRRGKIADAFGDVAGDEGANDSDDANEDAKLDDADDSADDSADDLFDASVSAAEAAAARLSASSSSTPRPVRVLICGDGAQGQRAALAATLHVLQGVPARTVSLAALVAEGEGDPAVGVVRGLREPLRDAARSPALLHLSGLESWALAAAELPPEWRGDDAKNMTGNTDDNGEVDDAKNDANDVNGSFGVAPSGLWDLFQQTVSGAGSANDGGDGPGCLMVVATAALPSTALPERVLRFFSPSDDVAGAGTTCAIVDLTAPSSAARAGVLARGAAAAAQGLVAPALAAAAARAARAEAAREREEEDEKEKEEEKDETAARELIRLRAARDAARAKAARDGAVRVLAEKAKRARDAVAAAVRTGAATLAREPRFAPALRRHRPARETMRAAMEGGFRAPAAFAAALRRAVAGLARARLRAREFYPGDGAAAAAAAAVDAAETMCHRLRRLAAAAERAEAEYYAAEAEAARADDKANEEMVAAEETMKARRDAAEDSEMKAAEETTKAAGNLADAEPPATPLEGAPTTHTRAPPSAPPSTRPSARARRLAAAVSSASHRGGPSVDETADAAKALATTLVAALSRAEDGAISTDALDALLGTCAESLARAARRAAPPHRIEDVLRDAERDVTRACAACVEDARRKRDEGR